VPSSSTFEPFGPYSRAAGTSIMDSMVPSNLDDETLLKYVRELIKMHPEARVTSLDPSTLADRFDAAEGLGASGTQLVVAMEQVGRVAQVDQARLLSHTFRVADERAVVETVALVDGSTAQAGLYDLRATLGVFVGVMIPTDGDGELDLEAHRRPRLPARVGHVRIGALGDVLHADDGAAELLGWNPMDPDAGNAFELIHLDDRKTLIACFIGAQSARDRTDRGRARLRRADGTYLWTEVSLRHVDDAAEPYTDIELIDISLEMATHDRLVERERLLDRLTNALPIGVLQIDQHLGVRFSNAALATLTGVVQPEIVDDAFETVVDEDSDRLHETVERSLLLGEDHDIEVRIAPAAGTPNRICSVAVRPLVDEEGVVGGAVICVRDVTAQVMERADLETRVTLDPLTRSLNRDGLMARLRRSLGQSEDGMDDPACVAATAVIYIDLDGFKQVNDSFGHGVGDRLLRATTERIRAAVREGDLVGRIGGDEFVAICNGIGRPSEALAIAARIADHLTEPHPDAPAELRASVGVVIASPGDERSAEALLADGDAAMYESKRAGLGRPVLFSRRGT
jgi:diguanylate cyclase (GGDEF)-like protein/PAS domain S-box-containing protein